MWTTKQLQSKVMESQNNILYQIASEGLRDFFFLYFLVFDRSLSFYLPKSQL